VGLGGAGCGVEGVGVVFGGVHCGECQEVQFGCCWLAGFRG